MGSPNNEETDGMKRRARVAARLLGLTLAVSGFAFAGIGTGEADQPPPLPTSKGDTAEGRMQLQLRRGTIVPPELLSFSVLQNCEAEATLTLTWNEEENWVKVHVKGDNVLIPHPDVDRTEGVDYAYNQWWEEPEDIQGGRYQLWIIMQSNTFTFYYDAQTLDLLGSEFDFPNGPPQQPFIPLHLPGAYIVPTDFIYPDEDGNIDFEQVWPYDAITRGDLPQFTHSIASFIPHNLCTANPFRYDLSTTRPYATPARPASEALSWGDFLKAGMIFDITIEPPSYYLYPPISTNIGAIGNASNVPGTVPPGWTIDWDATFGNVAPPIIPFGGAGSCEPYQGPPHIRSFNQCLPPSP